MMGRSQALELLLVLTQPTRLFSWSVMIHGPGGGRDTKRVALPK